MNGTTIRLLLALTCASGQRCCGPGTFKLRVRSAVPARFYLDDARGESGAPDGALVYMQRGERHFVVGNGFEIDLPSGSYILVAERGPEAARFEPP